VFYYTFCDDAQIARIEHYVNGEFAKGIFQSDLGLVVIMAGVIAVPAVTVCLYFDWPIGRIRELLQRCPTQNAQLDCHSQNGWLLVLKGLLAYYFARWSPG